MGVRSSSAFLLRLRTRRCSQHETPSPIQKAERGIERSKTKTEMRNLSELRRTVRQGNAGGKVVSANQTLWVLHTYFRPKSMDIHDITVSELVKSVIQYVISTLLISHIGLGDGL